ncbi:MAG: hypothetical protein K2K53_10315, partial [Oscillospiraceae bacterium]|nr:hypothetical protein [Oscillospiraceae bacterium]
ELFIRDRNTGRKDLSAKLLPWLCMVLGAALLVLGICLLQVVGLNSRLDELQQAVEAAQTDSQLQEEMERLQEKDKSFEATIKRLQEEKEEAEREKQIYMDDRDRTIQRLNITAIQKWRSDYLFYIGRFMENKDYPMAALVAALSANRYFSTASFLADVPYNPAQGEQYQVYCQELLDRGFLKESSSGYLMSGGHNYEMAGKYDPNQNPDMAALGILWCALDAYYVTDSYGPPEQYLITYQNVPLGSDAIPYPQRLRDTASDEILQLYEQLINDLIARGEVVITDGVLGYNPDLGHTSLLYSLPFDPPVDYGSIPVG